MKGAASIIQNKIRSIFGRGENHEENSFSYNSRSKRMIFEGSVENYIINGRVLLHERVSLFHGKTNTVPCLSVHDLNTRFHHWVLHSEDSHWILYDCFWDGRHVLAKTFKHGEIDSINSGIEQSCREIAVATQMGIHKNVHKLLACCLQTQIPVLIFEFVQNVHLHDVISRADTVKTPLLEWNDKLRIAWEISHAIAYLHSAFPRPIIHWNLKPENVFLDQHNVAKLSDFSRSILIPEDKTEVVVDYIDGTCSFMDFEYVMTGKITEKTDVYALGVILIVLLTGVCPSIDMESFQEVRECFMHRHSSEVADLVIIRNGVTMNDNLQRQLKGCVDIVVKCIAAKPDNRPSMEEVSTQLKDIITSSESSHYTSVVATNNAREAEAKQLSLVFVSRLNTMGWPILLLSLVGYLITFFYRYCFVPSILP